MVNVELRKYNRRYNRTMTAKTIHFKGLEAYELVSPNKKSQVVLLKYGAHICSYNVDGRELLFLSKEALWEPERAKAVRGGVPVVFPQFGPRGQLPAHGFARTAMWTVGSLEQHHSSTEASVTMTLKSHESFHVWSKAEFELQYKISLTNDHLTLEMKVLNQDRTHDMEFHVALHTYYNVDHIENVRIRGLLGLTYEDNTNKLTRSVEQQEEVAITAETDRVYIGAPSMVTLCDESRTIELRSETFKDLVVWNPWIDKAKSMSDFGDEEWRSMVCLEAANIVEPTKLQAGTEATFRHTIALRAAKM